MPEKEKKLYPGDEGYKGGISHGTVRINKKNNDVRIERDSNGNIVSTIVTPKILGIF